MRRKPSTSGSTVWTRPPRPSRSTSPAGSSTTRPGRPATSAPPTTQMPGNMALGAGRSAEDAYDSAEVIGRELEAVGVTQDYAPVSDVNINPNNPVIGIRSIGSDVDLVSDLAATQVKG